MSKETGERAILCRVCANAFDPKPYQIRKSDYECPSCKRHRQNAANALRDLSAYSKARYRRPEIKLALKEYHTRKKTDPLYIMKRAARRKVCTEIDAGRLQRGSCERCGMNNAEAHHHDYSKPLEVRWLCRKHHFQEEHRAD